MNSRSPALGVWPEIDHALAARQERGALRRRPRGGRRDASRRRPSAAGPARWRRRPGGWRAPTCRRATGARPRPSPSRTGGAPSVRRRNRPYSFPRFCSSNSTTRPSSDSAVGKDQSSHERLRSRASPGARPTISRCAVVRPTSTRPCGRDVVEHHEPEDPEEGPRLGRRGSSPRATIRSGRGGRPRKRTRPDRSTRRGTRCGSTPSGPTTLTAAWLSPRLAWSRNATSCPSRRDAHVRDPAARLVEDAADRVLEPPTGADLAHDGQALSVGGPVGVLDPFEDLTRGAAARAACGRASPCSPTRS